MLLMYTAFTISPSSQVVAVGQQAVFRCQNLDTDVIAWRVNESQELITVNNQPEDSGIMVAVDGTLNTLTIVAQSNYNETIVVCVAVFINNQMLNEETSPVNLTIQGK